MDNNEKEKILSSQTDTENSSGLSELEVEENKIKIISPGRMVIKRFFRSRLSVIGLVTLIALFAFSIFGPFFMKWGESEMDLRMAPAETMDYNIPTMEKVLSYSSILEIAEDCLAASEVTYPSETVSEEYAAGQNKAALFNKYENSTENASFQRSIDGETETIYFEVTKDMGLYTIYLLKEDKIVNPITGHEIPVYARINTDVVKRTSSSKVLNLNAAPSSDHWLGTDTSAYDVFTRLMYAGRISLTLGFVVVIIAVSLGVLLGGIAGYFGKWADNIIMRVVDILNCLPSLPILLIFSAILEGMDIDEGIRIYFLMGMLSLLSWTGSARMVRGQILMLREQEFMVAAEALGISVPRRIFKHLLPNIMPILIVGMTLSLGGTILTEATLSFLGLGIRPPRAAWGTMISSANDPQILEFYPNQWIPAGVMIILAVLAFNFVGDGLRDAFDPKMRR